MSTSHPPQIRIRSVSVHSTMDGEQTIPPSWKDSKQRPSFSPEPADQGEGYPGHYEEHNRGQGQPPGLHQLPLQQEPQQTWSHQENRDSAKTR